MPPDTTNDQSVILQGPVPQQPQIEPSKDAVVTPQLAALEKAQFELREKLLALREKDILELKEGISELKASFKIAVTVGAMAVVLAAGFGVKQYGDVDKTVNEALRSKIDKSLGYYEQFAKAVALAGNSSCSSAIPIFIDLASEREDDELVFMNLQNCYIETERYDEGYSVLARLREKGLFPRKFKHALSYNNAGYLVLVRSFSDAKLEGEAFGLLSRAETIALAENSADIKYPLWNLSLYYLSVGDLNRASLYSKRFREIEPTVDWWRGEQNKEWFRAFEKKRPNVKKQLDTLFPVQKQVR